MSMNDLTDEQTTTREPLNFKGSRDTGVYEETDGRAVVVLEGEHVSGADRRLVMRVEARIAALQASAQELLATMTSHLAAEYALQQGDKIEDDGTIVRVEVE